jgi:hypothetical protein
MTTEDKVFELLKWVNNEAAYQASLVRLFRTELDTEKVKICEEK